MKHSLGVATFWGLVILLVDRFSKFLAIAQCQEQYDVTPFLSCVLRFNRGVSWSLFSSESPLVSVLLILIISLVIVVLLWQVFKRLQHHKSVVPEIMIVAGALGNLIDRFMYGAVVDFILVHYKTWCFPVFNVADVAITLGVFFLILREWRNP